MGIDSTWSKNKLNKKQKVAVSVIDCLFLRRILVKKGWRQVCDRCLDCLYLQFIRFHFKFIISFDICMAIKAIIKVYRYFLQRGKRVWSVAFHFLLNHLLDRTLLVKVLTSVFGSAILLDAILDGGSIGRLHHVLDELFSRRKITATITISTTLWTFSLDSCIVLKIKLQINEVITW